MAERNSGQPGSPALDEVDRVFVALAHEARRQMLILLGQAGGELPSGYLAARFPHSWPTTSRHLKVLEEAGLVVVRRERRGSNYRLNRERLDHVVSGWLRYLQPADPEKRWSATGPRSTSALARGGAPDAHKRPREGKDDRDDSEDLPDHRRG